jgi:3-oxoacyl-[acyl-carrier protein] reductase/meso-butanediol dehydrogenase/(S,S)-butanediol dehydrogenase/diacetyl reductase
LLAIIPLPETGLDLVFPCGKIEALIDSQSNTAGFFMYDFKGKVALITGAARKRGMGHATAILLARCGADVAVNGRYRPPQEFPEEEKAEGWRGLDSPVEEIESHGVKGLAVTADIADRIQVQEMVERVVKEFGRLDILVANAGVYVPQPFLETEEELWHRHIAANLTGVFYCGQAAARHMAERKGGAIVNVASISGKMGRPNVSAYATSKFGVVGLTQVMAIELATYNIRVNAICPGRFLTDLSDYGIALQMASEKGISVTEAAHLIHADAVQHTPLGRLGYPKDAAGLIAFLCSDEASFITGQSINVDGGRLMAH